MNFAFEIIQILQSIIILACVRPNAKVFLN